MLQFYELQQNDIHGIHRNGVICDTIKSDETRDRQIKRHILISIWKFRLKCMSRRNPVDSYANFITLPKSKCLCTCQFNL